jgi:hydroxymethylpyrimidine/phosphomethylpyrimidine kinase
MTSSVASKAKATAIALTIAGSDSSGGAGIQADLKTFSAFGVYGASVITALTAQNTLGVQGIETVSATFVAAQMRSVLSDLDVGAIKTGMLANAEIVGTVAQALRAAPSLPLVVDPVMVATSGDVLLAPEAVDAIRTQLLPLATVVTPNLPEAAVLLGTRPAESEPEMADQGKALLGSAKCGAVLMKGGHGTGAAAVDLLVSASGIVRLERPRVETVHMHGTGCTLSAAIAALLAQGVPLAEAVDRAKTYVWTGLMQGRELGIGKGTGPVDHLFALRRQPPPA